MRPLSKSRPMQLRQDWPQLALVLGLTALVCFPGLELRDLTGDELGILGGSLGNTLDRSIGVDRPDDFSAHLPLAWVLRDAVQAVFGKTAIWTWRLHTALAVVAGAGLTWWVVRRYAGAMLATAAGLLVGLNPIVTFHARDSTNYALDPATGALLLAGLVAVAGAERRSGLLLAAGLLVGSVNDYYFFVTVGVAALITPLLVLGSPDRRATLRQAALGWGLYALAMAGPAWVFLRRLVGVELDAVFQKHAEPGDFELFYDDTVPRIAKDFALAYIEGYEGTSLREAWPTEVAWFVLMAAVFAGVLSRDRLARISALLVAGTVLCLGLIAVSFQNEFDRLFPLFPRNYLAVLPPLALIWARLFLQGLGHKMGLPGVLVLVLLTGGISLRQTLNASDTRARLVETLDAHREKTDALLTGLNLHLRVAETDFAAWSGDTCLPEGWDAPSRVWVFRAYPGRDDWALQRCSGEPLDDYQMRLHEIALTPPHDYQTNSHLTSAQLSLYERRFNSEEQAAGTPSPWTVRLTPRLASGSANGSIRVVWEHPDPDQSMPKDQPYAPVLSDLSAPDWATSLTIGFLPSPAPTWLSGASDTSDPDTTLHLPNIPLLTDPLRPVIEHPLWALSSPWVSELRRTALTLLWVMTWLALCGLGYTLFRKLLDRRTNSR